MKKNFLNIALLSLLGLNIAIFSVGCGSDRAKSSNKYDVVHDELTQPAKHYKVGQPYVIRGKKYYPKEDFSYKIVGMASWYGGPDHGKPTANGELFDENLLTAAHKTLQLPSVVKVTNLENGKSVIVRVNDRGPFIGNRVIDLSRRGAEILGFENKGLAKVKVEVLEEESRQLKEASLKRKKKRVQDTRLVKTSSKPGFQQIKQVDSGVYVQLASFQSADQGYNYIKRQKIKKGISLFKTKLERGTFYRVVIGPAKGYQDAKKLLKKLKRIGYNDAFIVNVP